MIVKRTLIMAALVNSMAAGAAFAAEGVSEKMVTLSFDNMQFDDEFEHLVVNMTEERLESMESFNYLEGEKRRRDITPG